MYVEEGGEETIDKIYHSPRKMLSLTKMHPSKNCRFLNLLFCSTIVAFKFSKNSHFCIGKSFLNILRD